MEEINVKLTLDELQCIRNSCMSFDIKDKLQKYIDIETYNNRVKVMEEDITSLINSIDVVKIILSGAEANTKLRIWVSPAADLYKGHLFISIGPGTVLSDIYEYNYNEGTAANLLIWLQSLLLQIQKMYK